MPKIVRTPQIQTRLSRHDNARLDRFCEANKKTKTEVTRDAIRWYLDNWEHLQNTERDTLYVNELRKMTDRIAALLSPMRVQTGTMYELAYNTCQSKDFFNAAKATATEKLQRRQQKLQDDERSMVKDVKKALGGGDSKA